MGPQIQSLLWILSLSPALRLLVSAETCYDRDETTVQNHDGIPSVYFIGVFENSEGVEHTLDGQSKLKIGAKCIPEPELYREDGADVVSSASSLQVGNRVWSGARVSRGEEAPRTLALVLPGAVMEQVWWRPVGTVATMKPYSRDEIGTGPFEGRILSTRQDDLPILQKQQNGNYPSQKNTVDYFCFRPWEQVDSWGHSQMMFGYGGSTPQGGRRWRCPFPPAVDNNSELSLNVPADMLEFFRLALVRSQRVLQRDWRETSNGQLEQWKKLSSIDAKVEHAGEFFDGIVDVKFFADNAGVQDNDEFLGEHHNNLNYKRIDMFRYKLDRKELKRGAMGSVYGATRCLQITLDPQDDRQTTPLPPQRIVLKFALHQAKAGTVEEDFALLKRIVYEKAQSYSGFAFLPGVASLSTPAVGGFSSSGNDKIMPMRYIAGRDMEYQLDPARVWSEHSKYIWRPLHYDDNSGSRVNTATESLQHEESELLLPVSESYREAVLADAVVILYGPQGDGYDDASQRKRILEHGDLHPGNIMVEEHQHASPKAPASTFVIDWDQGRMGMFSPVLSMFVTEFDWETAGRLYGIVPGTLAPALGAVAGALDGSRFRQRVSIPAVPPHHKYARMIRAEFIVLYRLLMAGKIPEYAEIHALFELGRQRQASRTR